MPKTNGLKAELHVHSNTGYRMKIAPFLYDSVMTEEEIIEECLKKDIKILAITDHNGLSGSRKARKIIDERKLDILYISSSEISSREGHILAYNIEKEIPNGLSAEKSVELIHEQGGLAFAAHPYNFCQGVKDLVYKLDFDGLEIENASIWHNGNRAARAAAKSLGLPGMAGSDAHWAECVGTGMTVFPKGTNTVDKFLAAMKKGDFSLEIKDTHVLSQIPKYIGKDVRIRLNEMMRWVDRPDIIYSYEKARKA